MATKNGLVPVHKVVSDNGRQLIQTFYVTLEESKKEGYQHHKPKKEGKDALQNLLRKIRKDLGSAEYRNVLKANDIEWEESEHDGANTMRATMSAYKFLMDGGTIDLEKTGKKVNDKLIVSKVSEKDSQTSKKVEEVKPNPVPKTSEPAFYRFIKRLGVSFRELNGMFIIGEGHKESTNKFGKPETAMGSIRLVAVEKEETLGEGHFIKLDSNFNDKEIIKFSLEGTFYKVNKKWYIPFRQFIEVFRTFKNIEIAPTLLPTVKHVMEKVDVDEIDLSKKPVPGGLRADKEIDISDYVNPKGIKDLELFPHQKKGYKFLLENKKAILGLAVGLGKTPTTIAAIKKLLNDGEIERALVIAPSSVKYNWKSEIEKFSDMKVMVLESGDLRGRKAENTWKLAEGAEVLIVNYEMLRNEPIRKKLHKLAPKCVIADEAHKLKNSKAQQTQGFRKTWDMADYKWFLSATPFPNGKPKETHTVLSHLRADKIGSWSTFGRQFVEWQGGSFGASPVGLKDIDRLKEKMSDVVFMRTHDSKDVTTSLPKERHITFSLSMTKEQKKMYKAIAEDIGSELRRLEQSGINASITAMIAKFKKLEQIAIDPDMLLDDPSKIDMNKLYPKEEWAVQTITDHLNDETNRGVVLFCDMKLPLEKIRKGLMNEGIADSEIAFITGSVKPEERTEVQNKMAKGEIKVVLCTNAAEEGVNLQHGAHTLIHLDQPWVPKAITQREGRVLRTGQPNPFAIFYSPIVTGTVEDKKRGTIASKVGIIEELLGEGSSGSVKNNIEADSKSKGGLTISDLLSFL